MFKKKIAIFKNETVQKLLGLKEYKFFKNAFSTQKFQFNFNTFHFYDGLVFVIFGISLPFILNILITYKVVNINNIINNRQLLIFLIDICSAVFVISYFLLRYKLYFIYQKGLIFFFIILFLPIVNQLINFIMQDIFFKHFAIFFGTYKLRDPFWPKVVSLISQVITEILAIFLIFIYDKNTWLRIKYFYKDSYYCFLVIGFIVIFNLLNLIITNLTSLKFLSKNQDSLTQFYKTTFSIIIFGLFTIIVAPIFEELTTRHGVFLLSGNKILGFFASSIFFAGMHVSTSGDWASITSYLAAGFVLSAIFIFLNGNVAYAITTHSIINIIAFTIGLINFHQ